MSWYSKHIDHVRNMTGVLEDVGTACSSRVPGVTPVAWCGGVHVAHIFSFLCCIFCFVVFVFVLCSLCCQFLWMAPFSLPLRYSLTFICPVSCVPYATSFSGLSIFDCPFGVL